MSYTFHPDFIKTITNEVIKEMGKETNKVSVVKEYKQKLYKRIRATEEAMTEGTKMMQDYYNGKLNAYHDANRLIDDAIEHTALLERMGKEVTK